MSSYKPPKQVTATVFVNVGDIDFICKATGSLIEGEAPDVVSVTVWIDHLEHFADKPIPAGELADYIANQMDDDALSKAMEEEYSSHYEGWGDYMYEQLKDRRMMQEVDKE